MRILLVLLTLLPAAALAQTESPSMPVYSSEAELWYAIASVAMVLSLAAAGWLVRRR